MYFKKRNQFRKMFSVNFRVAGKTSLWLYFPHTAAMCTLIALAVCNGPLLYDFTIIYKVHHIAVLYSAAAGLVQ